jgi:hypothetical protein
MGINPAVYMANYFLFYYEYMFLMQIWSICQDTPPVPGGDFVAKTVFERDDPGVPLWVGQSPENQIYNGNLAMYVLESFRFTRRFVDDLTAACNPFLQYLLYADNKILGGLIEGIYPSGNLVLEPTRADMWSFPTL